MHLAEAVRIAVGVRARYATAVAFVLTYCTSLRTRKYRCTDCLSEFRICTTSTGRTGPKFIRGNNGTGTRGSCPRRAVLSEVLVRMYLSDLEIPSST